ncbi:hypothetical protein RRG08_003582 [Elysia crispata]|uniref:Mpv17-like protein 2 n=1 Tax=Elysia crispata TaxID=231223 RepID=A0AAE0YHW7_9GAST|nr:hypothetical protein RRG08_003582 [Elysia crispata]
MLKNLGPFRTAAIAIFFYHGCVSPNIHKAFQSVDAAASVLSSIVCNVAADATVQLYFTCKRKQKDFDRRWLFSFKRSGYNAIVGLALGCITYVWHKSLHEIYDASELKDLAAVVVLESVVHIPLTLTAHIFGMGLLEKGEWFCVYEEWKQRFTDLYFTNLISWIPWKVCILTIAPIPCQTAYTNFYAYLWNVYLTDSLEEEYIGKSPSPQGGHYPEQYPGQYPNTPEAEPFTIGGAAAVTTSRSSVV